MILPIRNILFLGVLIGGGILLEIFLSKKGKWLGLILPAAFLVNSILVVSGIMLFSLRPPAEDDVIMAMVAGSFFLFIQCNIPTIVLLGIYAACRKNIRKNSEIDRMNIQDLE